ncbi:aspartate aminotransferase family protein, partial [Bacillus sp. S34]|nr:aspartate aminotransferase family protein [Bacillus sp. S34]
MTPSAPVDDAALQQKSRDHLWMHFARHGANQAGADVPIMVRGEGHHVYD